MNIDGNLGATYIMDEMHRGRRSCAKALAGGIWV